MINQRKKLASFLRRIFHITAKALLCSNSRLQATIYTPEHQQSLNETLLTPKQDPRLLSQACVSEPIDGRDVSLQSEGTSSGAHYQLLADSSYGSFHAELLRHLRSG